MNDDLVIGYLLSSIAIKKRECNTETSKRKPFEYGFIWRFILLLGAIFVVSIIAATIFFLFSAL